MKCDYKGANMTVTIRTIKDTTFVFKNIDNFNTDEDTTNYILFNDLHDRIIETYGIDLPEEIEVDDDTVFIPKSYVAGFTVRL